MEIKSSDRPFLHIIISFHEWFISCLPYVRQSYNKALGIEWWTRQLPPAVKNIDRWGSEMWAQQWLDPSRYLAVTYNPKTLSCQKVINVCISHCNVYCVYWQHSTTAALLHTMTHHCASITSVAMAEGKGEGLEHRTTYINLLTNQQPNQTTQPHQLQEGQKVQSPPMLRRKKNRKYLPQ